MKLTVLDVLKAVAPLQKMASADLPIAIALKLDDNMAVLNKVLAAFENKREKEKAKFSEDESEAFNITMDKVAEEEVDIDIKPLPLKDLEGVKLSSGEAGLVRWLIEAPG